MSDDHALYVPRNLIERWLVAEYHRKRDSRRRRLFVLLRRRLEAIAYAPGWEAKP